MLLLHKLIQALYRAYEIFCCIYGSFQEVLMIQDDIKYSLENMSSNMFFTSLNPKNNLSSVSVDIRQNV